jgi:HAD superfamily hydrolase (TIGR01509 family)
MQAVIFDVDGTLVDSVDLHAKAWQEAFAHFGRPVGFEQVRAQIGKGGDQLLPVFLSKAELDSIGPQLEKFRGELFKKKYLGEVRAFPQVRELFQQLRADGWKLAVASSAKKNELKIYEEICRISDLLDAETSADDAEKSKPHPDIFQAAVARLGTSPHACIVVGDSPYDAQAAGKAEISSIGFLCGGFPAAELSAAGFFRLYENAADVLSQYEQSVFRERRPT